MSPSRTDSRRRRTPALAVTITIFGTSLAACVAATTDEAAAAVVAESTISSPPLRPSPWSWATQAQSAPTGAEQPAGDAAVPAAQPAGHIPVGTTISRTEVIARALSWVTQGVPYSQSRWWADRNGTYRQDCSGFVSMAWRLDQRQNYWTGNLATVSHQIAPVDLQPGDILLLPGRHTVLFAGWADAQRTRFNLYEQYRPGYTARQVLHASLASYLSRGYRAYRYNGITGRTATHPAAVAMGTLVLTLLTGPHRSRPAAPSPRSTRTARLPRCTALGSARPHGPRSTRARPSHAGAG